jgi:hypothetical protein
MTNRKLSVALFAAAGAFGLHTASADVGSPQVLKVFGSSMTDVAQRVTQGSATTAARLRHSQNNQPGHEQPAIAIFSGPNGDGKTGIYVDRASNLFVPGSATAAVLPVDPGIGGGQHDRPAQGAMAMFQLAQDNTGAVGAKLLTSYTPQFITSHGSEQYRAFNQPNAYAINGGSAIAVEYNWRPLPNLAEPATLDNRTKRYLQVFNMQGQQILQHTNKLTGQTVTGEKMIYAKINDDCNMNMDGHAGVVASTGPGSTAGWLNSHIVMWRGCNGNGLDKGWMDVMNIQCNDPKAPTVCTHTDEFDIALDQQEERSRGYCSVDAANPNTAVCSWTAGNDQPQRDGVWLAAADITPGKYAGPGGTPGFDRQKAVIWSTMIDGRKPAANGTPATHAQRAMHERVMVYDPTAPGPAGTMGALVPSSFIIWRSGDARGNNDNNHKGGTYFHDNIGLFQIDSSTSHLTKTMPPTDYSQKLLGLDGTHLGISSVVMGQTDSLATQKPGLLLYVGSHTGGGTPAQISMLPLDAAPNAAAHAMPSTMPTNEIQVAGTGAASFDRHMYSNYLGENPGNQGRNFSAALTVLNPYCADGSMGKCDKVLSILATTGKDPSEVANVTTTPVQDTCYASDDTAKSKPYSCAQLKLSAYITVMGIAQHNGTGGGSGMGSGSGSNVGQGSGSGSGSGSSTGSGSDTSTDPGTQLGGCSTGSGAGGALSFLLIGLASFIRRRR